MKKGRTCHLGRMDKVYIHIEYLKICIRDPKPYNAYHLFFHSKPELMKKEITYMRDMNWLLLPKLISILTSHEMLTIKTKERVFNF